MPFFKRTKKEKDVQNLGEKRCKSEDILAMRKSNLTSSSKQRDLKSENSSQSLHETLDLTGQIDAGGGDDISRVLSDTAQNSIDNDLPIDQEIIQEEEAGGAVVEIELPQNEDSLHSIIVPEDIRQVVTAQVHNSLVEPIAEEEIGSSGSSSHLENPSINNEDGIDPMNVTPSVLLQQRKPGGMSIEDLMTTHLYRCLMNSMSELGSSSEDSSKFERDSLTSSDEDDDLHKNAASWTGPRAGKEKLLHRVMTATGLRANPVQVKGSLLDDPRLSFSSFDTCHSKSRQSLSSKVKRNAQVQSNWRLWDRRGWERRKWKRDAKRRIAPVKQKVIGNDLPSNYGQKRRPADFTPIVPNRRNALRVLRIENRTLDLLLRLGLFFSLIMLFCGIALVIVFISLNIGPSQYLKIYFAQNLAQFLLIILAISSPFFVGVFAMRTVFNPEGLRTFYFRVPLILWIQILMIILSSSLLKHVDLNLEDDLMTYRGVNLHQSLFDEIQNQFSCCGIHGVQDWSTLNLKIPDSCCKKKSNNCANGDLKTTSIWRRGCLPDLSSFYQRTIKAFIGFASLELIAEISAIIIFRLIYNQIKYVLADDRSFCQVLFGQFCANIYERRGDLVQELEPELEADAEDEVEVNEASNNNINPAILSV